LPLEKVQRVKSALGAQQDRWRHREAKRLGGLEVDQELGGLPEASPETASDRQLAAVVDRARIHMALSLPPAG
jgi:hypothetical protein